MTVKSGFFSDGSSYNQADFNAFLLDSIGSGYVLGYENELEVSANSPANMGVYVKTGRCYVQGYYGWVTVNEPLTITTANATNPRIDRVVARLSVSVNQSVTFVILTGTPAASPTAPALTRTSETYEISLAQIAVGAGVTSITSANITDERNDETVCGVAGVKHSWLYLTNITIDVSPAVVDAGVSDRDPVYFNGTKWVVATDGAVGFYDYRNDAVVTSGYLDGFTGLTPGAIINNRGVAISATEIVVLSVPVDTSGVKQVGEITGNITGLINADFHVTATDGVLTLGELFPAVSTSNTNTDADLVTTIVDDLQSKISAKIAIDSAHTIINPIGCTYPFNISVSYSVGNVYSSFTVGATNISGSTVGTWSMTGSSGTLVCSIPATTNKIVATVSYSSVAALKTCTCPAYYATF